MSYDLTLRPRSTRPISVSGLRAGLYALGFEVFEESNPQGPFDTGLSLIDVVADSSVPAGVVAIARIPSGWPVEDIAEEFVTLGLISFALNADILDGDVLLNVSDAALEADDWHRTTLAPFLARYLRSSRVAASPSLAYR